MKKTSTTHQQTGRCSAPTNGPASFFNLAVVQPKLTVGPAGDRYEQEADRVADQVVGSPVQRKGLATQITPLDASFAQRKGAFPVQGKFQDQSGRASRGVERQINASQGGGRPMDKATASEMGQQFGRDFSSVRIHTGGPSVQMSRELGARAFTVGNDIHFNQGEYNPGGRAGKHLLAHELTHVVQQNSAQRQIQRAPGGPGGTIELHETLTRQYSEETGVPYEPGLQYTEGYRMWLRSKNSSDSTGKTTSKSSQPAPTTTQSTTTPSKKPATAADKKPEGPKPAKGEKPAKKPKDKLKLEAGAGGGTKHDKKGSSYTANAFGNLKYKLGAPWKNHWQFIFKTGGFLKWQSSFTGPAKDKFDAGLKAQLDFLNFLYNSSDFDLTLGAYMAGSGGFKTEDDKTKSFGSFQTGLTGRFVYIGDIWEANLYVTGGFSAFDAEGKELVPGGFIYTGGEVYIRGNIGSDEHKVYFGPKIGAAYNYDSSQEKSEGILDASLMFRW